MQLAQKVSHFLSKVQHNVTLFNKLHNKKKISIAIFNNNCHQSTRDYQSVPMDSITNLVKNIKAK